MVDARQINGIPERHLHECDDRVWRLFLHHKSISIPKSVRVEVSAGAATNPIDPSITTIDFPFGHAAATELNPEARKKRAG